MNKLWKVTYEINGVEYKDTAEAFNKTAAESIIRQHHRGHWVDIIKIEELSEEKAMQGLTMLQAESVQKIAETKPALYEVMSAVAKHQIKKRRIDEQHLINESALAQQLTASLALCAGERTMEKLDIVMRAIFSLATSEIDDALDEIMKR